jgi:GNAT superfamily N-acetyltransferase
MDGDGILRRDEVRLGFAIRPCREGDLEAMEWMGLFLPHREIIHAAFDRQRQGEDLMLVADANGFPIGQVWIDFRRKKHEATALFWAIRVFPPLQNLGIGRHLLASAEDVVRTRGMGRVELGVERDNPGARRFYERHGYRAAGKMRDSYRYVTPDGRPATVPLDQFIMTKELAAGHRRA